MPFDPPMPMPSPAELAYMRQQEELARMHALEQERLWWESVTEEERQQVTRQRELERKAAQEASEQVAAEQAARRAAEAEAARQAAAREAAEHQRRIDTVSAK